MAHNFRARLARPVGIGFLLAAAAVQAQPLTYSPAQQASAVDALSGVIQKLNQVEQRLLPAYGSSPPVIRMEELKRAAAAEPAVQTPNERLQRTGAQVLERIASFEPLWSACGLSHESIEVLDALSHRTGELLQQRGVASTQQIADFAREGGAQGQQRLAHAHELNCRPVRTTLNGSLAALQDAYAPVAMALATRIGDTAGDQPATASAKPGTHP